MHNLQWTNAIRIPQSYFEFQIFCQKCDRSANADMMTTLLFLWSWKPWSSYSSCHATVHNLTAVSEQMRWEFCNLMFEFQFFCHQCDRRANADIFKTSYFIGAENHEVPTVAAIPKCTISPQSMKKYGLNSAISILFFIFYTINVTTKPMLTFLTLFNSMEQKTFAIIIMQFKVQVWILIPTMWPQCQCSHFGQI